LNPTEIIQLWADGQFLYSIEYCHPSQCFITHHPLLALEALALSFSVAPGALFYPVRAFYL
jgi:hypothetical protein